MKNLLFLLLTFSFNASSQNCETELFVCNNSFNECEEQRQDLQDLLLDGITDEEIQDYCDVVLGNNQQLKEERDEAILLKNAAELKLIQAQLALQKIDSFFNLVLSGTVEFNDIKIKGSIKPPNNE